ncbi:MAG: hypothetical protein D6784_03465 [Chloroflexi bacterium]|nr:MAG: hypothetical protein D6784_03465 [Chloroflexota bacterium]
MLCVSSIYHRQSFLNIGQGSRGDNAHYFEINQGVGLLIMTTIFPRMLLYAWYKVRPSFGARFRNLAGSTFVAIHE